MHLLTKKYKFNSARKRKKKGVLLVVLGRIFISRPRNMYDMRWDEMSMP
jgi:hypothetical protein